MTCGKRKEASNEARAPGAGGRDPLHATAGINSIYRQFLCIGVWMGDLDGRLFRTAGTRPAQDRRKFRLSTGVGPRSGSTSPAAARVKTMTESSIWIVHGT
jgi:hypothetical protein